MFKNLLDFQLKRNCIQALGFYIAYLILGLILCGIISGIAAQIMLASGYHGAQPIAAGVAIGRKVGPVVILIYCSSLAVILLRKKGLSLHFGAILLALVSILLSFMGGILGLIPLAVISTMGDKKDIQV